MSTTGYTSPLEGLHTRKEPGTVEATLNETVHVSADAYPYTTKTANYTLLDSDSTVEGDATSGAITLTLPDAATCKGRRYTILKADSSGNVVNVGTTSSQTINGATAPYTGLSAQWAAKTFQSNGANWRMVG